MRYIVTFLIFFLIWIIWSGIFDPFQLALGVISCAMVTYITHNILFTHEKFSYKQVIEAWRFIKYIPWLLWQITLSNIHVAGLVLNPKMPIDPHIIRVNVRLKKNISITTYANSITLTPGTITADVIEGEFLVHCISKKVADDLLTGDMENRVAHIFMEDQIEGFFLGISLALFLLVLLCLYRTVFGPTVFDRIISVSVIGTKTTIILLLIGFIYKRVDMFVDISLAYALLNLIVTIVAAKFFRTKKNIMPE